MTYGHNFRDQHQGQDDGDEEKRGYKYTYEPHIPYNRFMDDEESIRKGIEITERKENIAITVGSITALVTFLVLLILFFLLPADHSLKHFPGWIGSVSILIYLPSLVAYIFYHITMMVCSIYIKEV